MKRLSSAGAAMVLVACATGAAQAQNATLPPIVDPASQEHHPGKVIFVQLTTTDMASAKQFYSGLFGWSFRDVPGTRVPFSLAYVGSEQVAAIAERPAPAGARAQPTWLSFFSTPDVDGAAKLAAGQGARVLSAPRDVPGLGREAVMADPQGAVFGVLASSSGDPADALKPDGVWIWRSLMTPDPTKDAGFYDSLFGFTTYAFPSPAGQQHLLLQSENYARASVNTPPGTNPGMHPHWLNYVRVDNAAQTVARAAQLGGRVLVQPHTDRHGGMVAVVADPQGAPVGLLEWGDSETKAVSK